MSILGVEHEECVYGTMNNFDGDVNNAGGTMDIQNHMQLLKLEQC